LGPMVVLGGAAVVGGAGLVGRPAQASPLGLASMDASAVGAPALSNTTASAAVPLLVTSGIGVSRVQLNSQPLVISEAAPVYSPLAESGGLLGVPPLPAYPWCYSYYPGSPSEAACGGQVPALDGLSLGAATGTTSSTGSATDPTSLSGRAATVIGGARAATSIPFTIANAASAAVATPQHGALTAGASTSVSGINLAGVLSIRQIRSSATGTVNGQPGGSHPGTSLVVSGATVGGQGVTIDTSGVHVLGQSPLGTTPSSLQDQVDAALAAAGLSVTLLPASTTAASPDGTSLSASSGGVEVGYLNGSQGISEQVVFGQSTVTLQAGIAPPVASGPSTALANGPAQANGTGAGGAGGGGGGASGNTSSLPASSFSAGTSNPQGAVPAPPIPGAGAGAPLSTPFYRIGAAFRTIDWRPVYRATGLLALAGIALALVPRTVLNRRRRTLWTST
ncbi:MAG: hypothetical protein ACYCTI_10520, partial [Acidimicrobiales bacterium]